MATITDTLSEIIRETIDDGIDQSLPKLDKVAASTIPTSQGVVTSGIGRNWQVKHTFCASLAGSHGWRAAAGGSVSVDGSATDANPMTIYGTGALQSWQGMEEMSSPGYVQRTLSLKEGFGNFPVPLHLLRSDRIDASIGSAVAEIVKGAAKRNALSFVHSFWKVDSNNTIGTFAATGETIPTATATPGGLAFTLTGGRIRSFYPGMSVSLFNGTTNIDVTATAAPYWVANVDYLAKKIFLVVNPIAGEAPTTLMPTATVSIQPYDSSQSAGNATVGPSGLEDWIKSTGTVFGIDVAKYSQFRSIVVDPAGTVMTSDVLNRHIGGLADAYGAECDTIVTTAGTMLGILNDVDTTGNLLRYDTQGQALNVTGGFQPYSYVYDGMNYRFMTSSNCPLGTAYIIKLGGQNIKKYVPPRLQGAGTQNRFGGQVEFIAPLAGSSNIFLLVRSSDSPTNFLQAPYLSWCEVAPRNVVSAKLTGFTEQIYTG